MEYANDETRWTSKITQKIMKHKLITMSILAFLVFSSINIIMIINFFEILQNL